MDDGIMSTCKLIIFHSIWVLHGGVYILHHTLEHLLVNHL